MAVIGEWTEASEDENGTSTRTCVVDGKREGLGANVYVHDYRLGSTRDTSPAISHRKGYHLGMN